MRQLYVHVIIIMASYFRFFFLQNPPVTWNVLGHYLRNDFIRSVIRSFRYSLFYYFFLSSFHSYLFFCGSIPFLLSTSFLFLILSSHIITIIHSFIFYTAHLVSVVLIPYSAIQLLYIIIHLHLHSFIFPEGRPGMSDVWILRAVI